MQLPVKERITEDDLQLLRYPALLLNEALVVTGRNRPCAMFPIRKSCKITRYLFSRDILRLQKMTTGQVIRISLNVDGVYLVFAKKLGEGYLLALRTITALVWEKVGEKAAMLPTGNERIGDQLNVLRSSAESGSETEKTLRKNFLHTLRFQMVTANLLSAKMRSDLHPAVYELNGQVSVLMDESILLLKNAGFLPTYHPSDKPSYARIDVDALRFAVTELLVVSSETAIGGKVVVDSATGMDEFTVRFSFEPLMDDELYEGILSGEYSGELLRGAYSDVFFDLFLAQMICERNGWDFRVRSSGESGVACLTVAIPTSNADALQVNCITESGDLVAAMLSDLIL